MHIGYKRAQRFFMSRSVARCFYTWRGNMRLKLDRRDAIGKLLLALARKKTTGAWAQWKSFAYMAGARLHFANIHSQVGLHGKEVLPSLCVVSFVFHRCWLLCPEC